MVRKRAFKTKILLGASFIFIVLGVMAEADAKTINWASKECATAHAAKGD